MNESVELPQELIETAIAVTGKRSARAAIVELVRIGAKLPNVGTARVLRAKAGKRDRVFRGGKEATAFLSKRYG